MVPVTVPPADPLSYFGRADCAVEVEASASDWRTLVTILLIFGAIAALYLVCLAFRAAALALPLYAGLWIAVHLISRGYGHGTAILAGLAAGIFILVAARLIVALVPSGGVRAGIAALFVIPAGLAGYQLAYGIGQLLIDPGPLLVAGSAITALVVAASAANALIVPPGMEGQGTPPVGHDPAAKVPPD